MLSTTDEVAGALYRSKCLKFGRFKIKSGASSPYYIDLSCLLSSPKELCTIAKTAAEVIRQIMEYDKISKLASIALKGALILPIVGLKLDLPCVIIRKEDKAYGVTGRVAGAEVLCGDEILFFDDVISAGVSKLEGVKPLETLGAQVKHLLVVVDREQGGKEKLESLGYQVHALARISEIVRSLDRSGSIPKEQSYAVLKYVAE